jgi:hypothetical protein
MQVQIHDGFVNKVTMGQIFCFPSTNHHSTYCPILIYHPNRLDLPDCYHNLCSQLELYLGWTEPNIAVKQSPFLLHIVT